MRKHGLKRISLDDKEERDDTPGVELGHSE